MRAIREGTAIYYLGEFRVAPPDTLKFTVTVEMDGEPAREIVFNQKFCKQDSVQAAKVFQTSAARPHTPKPATVRPAARRTHARCMKG